MMKILMTATVLSAMATGVLLSSVGIAPAQGVDAPPSWQAICGYKWRQYKAEHAGTTYTRSDYVAFMRKPEADGGCGAKAARGSSDQKIKEYLDSHPAKPQTRGEGSAPWLEAKGKGKRYV